MKIKDILPYIYSSIELIDISTDQVMISCTPEYKQKLKKYMEQPVYAIITHKNVIRIITNPLEETLCK